MSPIKATTIPRLELTAATVSIRIGAKLIQDLSLNPNEVTYHTDSTTVLHYNSSEKRRFPVFVSNCVQLIRDHSSPHQWRYVETGNNPADDASRGLSSQQDISASRWLKGPEFLWKPEESWPQQPLAFKLETDPYDAIDIDANVITIGQSNDAMDKLIYHYSDWNRLQKSVAIFRRI